MLPFHDLPDGIALASPLRRALHRLASTLHRYRRDVLLSWLTWALIVTIYAMWTYLHDRPPAGPAWIGMSIRTGVFATWTLVARTWLVIASDHP